MGVLTGVLHVPIRWEMRCLYPLTPLSPSTAGCHVRNMMGTGQTLGPQTRQELQISALWHPGGAQPPLPFPASGQALHPLLLFCQVSFCQAGILGSGKREARRGRGAAGRALRCGGCSWLPQRGAGLMARAGTAGRAEGRLRE